MQVMQVIQGMQGIKVMQVIQVMQWMQVMQVIQGMQGIKVMQVMRVMQSAPGHIPGRSGLLGLVHPPVHVLGPRVAVSDFNLLINLFFLIF